MKMTCTNCGLNLDIPDEKIPDSGTVRIGCPKCRHKTTLDKKGHQESLENIGPMKQPDGIHDHPSDSVSTSSVSEAEYGYDDYSGDKTLEFYEEGTRLGLVLESDSGRCQSIRKSVEELGYVSVATSDVRSATGKMRFHPFDLVLLSDGFDGQGLKHNPILNYMNRMAMSVRRKIFLALISDHFKTMDNMMAFAMSANVVINANDLDRLAAILKRAVSDNDAFYKVFKDTLIEVGKA